MMTMSGLERASYVFVSGKNWRLSLAELVSFLEARGCVFKVASVSREFFVVESEGALDPRLVDGLGGTIKLGRVVSRVPVGIVVDAFVRGRERARGELRASLSADCGVDEVFGVSSGRCVFGVSVYFESPRFLRFSGRMQRFLGSFFKGELESRGRRARFMGFPRGRGLPRLTHVEVLRKGLVEKSAEVLFCVGREEAFVAKTVAVHDPFEFQKRDVGRPVQRRIFSMPPRLAKIMVNLSLCLPGRVLVDPFCGVGAVLQEGLLVGARVVGVDVDSWCVGASRRNLDWLKGEYGLEGAEYEVLRGDARRLTECVGEGTVDCVVTEPVLGPALRGVPTESYARRVVGGLESLYFDFLGEAYRVLRGEGRLVVVTPYIKSRSGVFVRMGLGDRAVAVGFRVVCPFERGLFGEDNQVVGGLVGVSSFVDMEERHRVGREVWVFQK
jgi:tRNA G10  N-methylase Trm11